MQQRTPEWHEFRRNHIGSSDAPVIMGVSPWSNVKRLYIEKTEGMIEINETEPMRRGNDLEPIALAHFEAITGYLMQPAVLQNKNLSYMAASLDGLSLCGKQIVEIKCPGKVDHQKALDGQVPEKYVPQLQHQMVVAGLNKIHYMSYVSNDDYKILEIYKDDEYIAKLLEKEAAFWECVVNKMPPQFEEKCIEEIHDPRWQDLSQRYQLLQSQRKCIEEQEKLVRDQIIMLANGKDSYGYGMQLSKVISKGKVVYSKVPKSINLDQYRGPDLESWRINFK